MAADIAKNTVSSKGQVRENEFVRPIFRGGKKNVLFIGNSITRHEVKKAIGWENDWGMAASKEENDYVHVTVRKLDERFGKVNYCIVNCGEWEQAYYNDELLEKWSAAQEFNADILIVRIGENIFSAKDALDKEPLSPHFERMVKFFQGKDTKKVIVTDLFWSCEKIDSAIEEVARKNGYDFVRLGELGADDKNKALGQFWHKGVALHPNDRGMRLIAERIVEKI